MELKDVKCFLLDMDGTFYLGNQLIDGSLSFIDKVVSSGLGFPQSACPSTRAINQSCGNSSSPSR